MNIPSQNIFLGLILTFTTVHKILCIIFFTYGSQYVFNIYNNSQNSLINFSLKIFFKVHNGSQWYTYIIANYCEQYNSLQNSLLNFSLKIFFKAVLKFTMVYIYYCEPL